MIARMAPPPNRRGTADRQGNGITEYRDTVDCVDTVRGLRIRQTGWSYLSPTDR
jgi:hypothetical protein